jgi:ABC-2 type transport system permease protein
MEIVSDTMKVVGHLTPTAWAMDLMNRLISFGGGAGDVVTEVAVLLGFAVGANALAAKCFKY